MNNDQQTQKIASPANNLGEPTMSPIHTINHHQQRGVVLVVSLLILLVLTLLGISSLDSSILEEKMAANTQTANFTFQKAESAIRRTFYVESQDAIGAFENAGRGDTETYNETYTETSYDLAADTAMSVPATTKANVPCPNSGANYKLVTIEVTGTAGVSGITSRHTQGYDVCVPSLNP